MKRLSIGISDFKKLIDGNYYYVDKSLLIDELLEAPEIVLITRPRRFGKTLNLSMLHYFFEKSTENNQYLFSNLKVWQNKKAQAVQGQYPVIFLSFKDIKGMDWASAFEKFAFTISEEFYRHAYLLEGDGIDEHRKALFTKIMARQSSQAELENSLLFLAKLLYTYHKQKVVVLIDEYDIPIQEAYIHGYYQKALNFARSLLGSILKDSIVLEKGVLTGILTLAKAGIFSGLNNLKVYNVTHEQCADKFGFTQKETETMLAEYKIHDINTVKEWYDGYTFGNMSGMYNPWSVLNCVDAKGKIELYWVNTSDNILIKTLIARSSISVKEELELILSQSTVPQQIEESVVFTDLDYKVELVWGLLLFSGYLSYDTCQLKEGTKYCNLRIPNQEIKNLYIKLIREIFQAAVLGGQVQNLLKALIENEVPELTRLLQSFVSNSISMYDLPQTEPEKSYHLFVLGLLVTMSEHYIVKSNRESGLGRYDIILMPKHNDSIGIIIEFKIVKSHDTLKETAELALQQIVKKQYAQELEQHQVKKIIAYGIAFEGKTIFIKSQMIK